MQSIISFEVDRRPLQRMQNILKANELMNVDLLANNQLLHTSPTLYWEAIICQKTKYGI